MGLVGPKPLTSDEEFAFKLREAVNAVNLLCKEAHERSIDVEFTLPAKQSYQRDLHVFISKYL